MDYYGLLFLYYLKGLSGKSVLRLFFNIEVGGTEQLLPENTSTPTTTPILADIQYPDGLRTDQYFTYRETPTPVDGLAKIKSIKGNTLVWNQVAPSMSSSAWVQNRCTKTVSGNTFTLVGTNHTSLSFGVYIALTNLKLTVNHNYLFMCVVNTNRGTQIRFTFDSDIRYTTITPNKDNVYSRVVSTATEDPVVCYVNHPSSITTSDTATIKNLMIVDLTMLNDSRVTDYDSFRTYYPLDYYAYNQGTLLSFNGNGIKTVGKNLFNVDRVWNYSMWINSNNELEVTPSTIRLIGIVPLLKGKSYTVSFDKTKFKIASVVYTTMNTLTAGRYTDYVDFTSVENTSGAWSFTALHTMNMLIYFATTGGQTSVSPTDLIGTQLEIGTTPSSYEPYTSSTLSLPISTYFPTGMKSAGTVYDELTPTKGITRIGAINLGSLNWYQLSTRTDGFFTNAINPIAKTSTTNLKLIGYTVDNAEASSMADMTTKIDQSDGTYLYIINSAYESNPSGLKASLDGVYLYYELATPTETPITTEDANEALSLLLGKSVSSSNANQLINIITKGE